MPTYRIVLDSSKVSDLVVEAAIIDFSHPDCVTLLDENDKHIIAAIPNCRDPEGQIALHRRARS